MFNAGVLPEIASKNRPETFRTIIIIAVVPSKTCDFFLPTIVKNVPNRIFVCPTSCGQAIDIHKAQSGHCAQTTIVNNDLD